MKSVHENSTGYLIKIFSMVNENSVSQINRVFSLLFTDNLKVKSEFWITFIWSQTFKEHSEGLVKTINLCLLVSKSSGN